MAEGSGSSVGVYGLHFQGSSPRDSNRCLFIKERDVERATCGSLHCITLAFTGSLPP